MKSMRTNMALRHVQRGVTLVVVMMILLIVTVVGISAARISLLGEKSARFDRDYQVAFQAAEAALMDAEFDINGPNTSANARTTLFASGNEVPFTPDCGTGGNQGLCAVSNSGVPIWFQVDFTDTSSNAHTAEYGYFTGRPFQIADSSSTGIKPAQKPRYIIEVQGLQDIGSDAQQSDKKIYRITAMGFGPRADVVAVLQTTFQKE